MVCQAPSRERPERAAAFWISWTDWASMAGADRAQASAAAQMNRMKTSWASGRLDGGERLLDVLGRIFIILELARDIALVGSHIEMAVTAQAEQDGSGTSRGASVDCLVDSGTNGVRRLRSRQDALGARELQGGFEDGQLRIRHGVNVAELAQMADERRCAVITKAAGVNAGRNE